jgi:integrase
MTEWEEFLGINGWESQYPSVQRFLDHLARRTKSDATKLNYCHYMFKLCKSLNISSPEDLVTMQKEEVKIQIERFLDNMLRKGRSKYSVRNAKGCFITFFKCNGFKGEREFEIENYPVEAYYRYRNDYYPTKNENLRMIEASGSLLNRAILYVLHCTGLRNSTLRALCYGDIRMDLENGEKYPAINIQPSMKKRVPNACKGNVSFTLFLCEKATEAVTDYLRCRKAKYGSIADDEPLFPSNWNQIIEGKRPSKIMTPENLRSIVKNAAKKAGISEWKHVTVHGFRTTLNSIMMAPLKDGSNMDPQMLDYFLEHIPAGSTPRYFDRTKIDQFRLTYSKINFDRTDPVNEELMKKMRDMEEKLQEQERYIQTLKQKESNPPDVKHVEKLMDATNDENLKNLTNSEIDATKDEKRNKTQYRNSYPDELL